LKKLKNKLSILLLLLYVTVAFNYLIPVLTHYIFNDYIIQKICVQREIVENSCQGKCHLTKQINEKKENTSSQTKVKTQIDYDFSNIIHQFDSDIFLSKKERIYYTVESTPINFNIEPIKPPPKYYI
jgi:hypothetical protein